jgi:hypothetical protein
MHRRHFLAGAATLVARPTLSAPALGGASKMLTFVPTTSPPSYGPLWSQAQATRTLGLMIYETLYTRDMARWHASAGARLRGLTPALDGAESARLLVGIGLLMLSYRWGNGAYLKR